MDWGFKSNELLARGIAGYYKSIVRYFEDGNLTISQALSMVAHAGREEIFLDCSEISAIAKLAGSCNGDSEDSIARWYFISIWISELELQPDQNANQS